MDDQLDEELKNRIEKVFDEYADPSADEGWSLLREKFPEEKANRRAIIWWWSAAAVLLLMLGLGVWKYAATNQAGNLAAVKPLKPTASDHLATAKPSPATTVAPQPAATDTTAATTNTTTPIVKNNSQSTLRQAAISHVNHNRVPFTAPRPKVIIPYTAPNVKPASANQSLMASKTPDTIKHAGNRPATNQLAVTKADSAKHAFSQQSPVNQIANVPPPVNHITKADSTLKPKSMAEMFAQNDKPRTPVKDRTGLVRFGVFAGSYVNYARGSSNQSNLGGGVSAELRITKNLKLVSGVAVAGNTLNYGGGIPTTAAQTTFLNVNVPGAATSPGPSSFSVNATSEVTSAAAPAFKNYGVSMVGIDIPLNLKYDFDPKNFSLYFMTGLSSGTFVNETYTYQYNYPAISSPLLQQTHNESSTKSFNGFYFGRMLNLAVGFGYPVGNNRLILEPFLKYPLQGLGSQNLKFGAGGINLKFNFPTFGK